MKQLRAEKLYFAPWHKNRVVFSAIITLLMAAALFSSGCAKKDNTASAPPTGQGQPAVAGAAGAEKPTAWQEAAKQRALQQGPAIEAALKAQQQGK